MLWNLALYMQQTLELNVRQLNHQNCYWLCEPIVLIALKVWMDIETDAIVQF